MSIPSFLHKAGKNKLDDSVTADLHLESLLPNKILPIVMSPCDKQTVILRQEFFQNMENTAFLEHIHKLLGVLRTINAEKYHYSQAELHAERILLYLRVLHLYLEAVQLLRCFPCENKITDAVCAYWNDCEHSALYNKLQEVVSTADLLAEKICVFDLSLMDRTWIQPDNGSKSYCEIFESYAWNLGISLSKADMQTFRLSLSLSNALCEMYVQEFASLDALLAPFEIEKLTEPLVYIDELEFYVYMHGYIRRQEQEGINTCFPKITDRRQYYAENAYDPYLLQKQIPVVPNDIAFDEERPFFFLIGANSGGKTTYLRCVALNLVFALCGCKVFAANALVFCFERIYTHFPRDERFEQMGRLEDEKKRFDNIIGENVRNSFVFLNEAYSGANDDVGEALAINTAQTIREKQMFGFFVTHFQNVCEQNVPALHVTVDDQNNRLYKVQPIRNAVSSYVEDILKKYGLDRDSLHIRLREYE